MEYMYEGKDNNLPNGMLPKLVPPPPMSSPSIQLQQQQQLQNSSSIGGFMSTNTQKFSSNSPIVTSSLISNNSPNIHNTIAPSKTDTIQLISSSSPVPQQQYQMNFQQPQQHNYQNKLPVKTMQISNNSFLNGGGSDNSSRTESPIFNMNSKTAIMNQQNLNSSANNISLLNTNSNVFINQQQHQVPMNSNPTNSNMSDGNNSKLENKMKNLTIENNSITNGFQTFSPTNVSSNVNSNILTATAATKTTAAIANPLAYQHQGNIKDNLNNQQQQHKLPKNLDNEILNSSSTTNNILLNKRSFVPANNLYDNQQQNMNSIQPAIIPTSISTNSTAITSTQLNYNNMNNVAANSMPPITSNMNNNMNYTNSFNNSNTMPMQNQTVNSMYKPTMPPLSSPPTTGINQTMQCQQQPQRSAYGIRNPNPTYPMPPSVSQQTQQRNFQQAQPSSVASPSSMPPPMFAANQPANIQSQKYPPSQQLQGNTANYPSVTKQGFNKLWGQDVIDLMQHRHILPYEKVQPPRIVLNNQFYESVNCNSDIMRCTLSKIPENNNLLQKSRLPLGILVHPFRDINSLPVIQCPNIVRCRLCRTYINPFVYFVDSKMWKCNLCYRVNELPEDFQYDPATKTYGDVTRRPEVRSSTIEFIAPSEYMLRPPQPAIYLFLFDVSILAQQSGYLETVCGTLLKYLDDLPGDARTKIGFIAFNSEIHFYNITEGYSQPHEMTLVEIDDPFLPRPDNLLVNLKENRELIKDLLNLLPKRFEHSHDPGSVLGAALQVAYKLMCATGGRVTVFQTCLPNKGPGALQPREDPNNRSSKDVLHLNPATDFYKRHALECSGYQIAVDLFVLNQQYCDLATISGVSKYSGGSIYHFPLYQKTKPQQADSLKQCLKRYLTRKIGFEAVMRIRCTRGLQVHTFHGNFFVRSTDLLSLPNINPDAGYGMQISYEENLIDVKTMCFQSALLYTNSEGERRIRVHTLCLPVTSSLHEVMHAADSQAIVSLLSKMAVDRSISSSVTDARDAFINATIDIINSFKTAQNLAQGQNGQLIVSKGLSLLPLYISALLKHVAFRIGTSTRLDDRIAAMDSMKTLPLDQLMKSIYPEYYILDSLFYNTDNETTQTETQNNQSIPPLLQLSAEFIDSRSMFLIDSGPLIMIYVGLNVPANILENVLGVQSTSEIPDYCYGLQLLKTSENIALRKFIDTLNEEKPYLPTIQIIRDTSTCRSMFIEKLIDDRGESSLSYYEFLQHLRSQIK